MSSLLQKLILDFKTKLERNYSLKIPDDWLSQCAEFLLEEFPGKSINEYYDLIFKQLLDYDLTVIGTNCLPNYVFNSETGTLNGNFLLQLRYCFDVTQSYFSVIQKLRGIISENALVDADNVPGPTQFERKEKKNRLLSLYLTDGKNNIVAFENKIISFLNDDLLPGTKIELKGRINFQNGVLFLDPENVKVLGGFIEEISTHENLIKVLEQEIASKYEDGSSARREKTQTFDTSSNSQRINRNQSSPTFNQTKQKFYQNNHQSSSYPKFKNEPKLEDDDEDEILMSCDLNSFESKQRNYNQKSNRKGEEGPVMKRPPSYETITAITKQTNQNYMLKKQKINDVIELDDYHEHEDDFKSFKKSKNNYKKNDIEEYDEDIELLNIDEKSLKTNKNFLNINSNSNKENYRPINQISNCIVKILNLLDPSFISSCCFINKPVQTNGNQMLANCFHTIKCFFKQVTSPLTQNKMKWYQDIIVSDGNDDMLCYLDDEPLNILLEMTCKEAKDLFKKSKETGNKEYNLLFEQKRKNCEQKLKTLNALMHFKYDFDKKKFCIYKLENIEYNRN